MIDELELTKSRLLSYYSDAQFSKDTSEKLTLVV